MRKESYSLVGLVDEVSRANRALGLSRLEVVGLGIHSGNVPVFPEANHDGIRSESTAIGSVMFALVK